MILTRLSLHNFRQYRGRQELTFATDKSRNVSTVTGPNGAGKTGIFLALNWCLYGTSDDRGDLLNQGLVDERRGSVEVHFVHGGRRFVARREVWLQDGQQVSGPLELVQLSSSGAPSVVANPTMRLNTILPADARRYFFFDAERIDEMSRAGHEADVAEAVRAVMKMEVLERTVRHLKKAEKALKDKVTADEEIDAEARRITGTIESVEEELSSKRAELEEVREDEVKLAEAAGVVSRQLAELHDVATDIRREGEIAGKLAAIDGPRADRLNDMRDRIGELLPAVAGGALAKASSLLDDWRSREEHVGWHAHQLDDILASGECVCGRSVDAEASTHLKDERERALLQPDSNHVVRLSESLVALTADREATVQDAEDSLVALDLVRDQANELHRELEELRAKLARHPSTDVKQLERERNHLEQERRLKASRVGSLKQMTSDLENRLKVLRKELQRSARVDNVHTRLTRKFELCSRTRSVAERLLHEYQTDTRTRLEDATDQIFKRMIWKEGQFQRVRITERYALDVVDRHGASALAGLSAGERQVLSLSFILAMARVAGDEAPIVIDTPFGRISDAPLQNIAAALPELADQLILLLTDRELTGEAAGAVEDLIGRTYQLDFDDRTGVTTVVETTEDAA